MVRRGDPTAPPTGALNSKSMPDASEKLIAACRETPRPSSTADVVPTLTSTPPAGIGRIEVAAERQITTSANDGENPAPSALRRSVHPTAPVVQQPNRKPAAMNVDRDTLTCSPTRPKDRRTRFDRSTN